MGVGVGVGVGPGVATFIVAEENVEISEGVGPGVTTFITEANIEISESLLAERVSLAVLAEEMRGRLVGGPCPRRESVGDVGE